MEEYTIDHSCSDKNQLQLFLNSLYGYTNNYSLKVQHRGRINLFYALMNKNIRNGIIKKFDNALDIGCNSGIYSKIISDFGCKKVTGIDITDNSMTISNQYFASNTNNKLINFQLDNAETYTSTEKFDFILCTEVIEHTTHPEKVVENIKDLLATGGIAVITLPNRISWPYLVEYLAYKIRKKPYNQELIDHMNYPFNKSIKMFNKGKTKVIQTCGSNALLDSIAIKLLYKTPLFGVVNRFNFFLSKSFPFKYFSQFFYVVITKV